MRQSRELPSLGDMPPRVRVRDETRSTAKCRRTGWRLCAGNCHPVRCSMSDRRVSMVAGTGSRGKSVCCRVWPHYVWRGIELLHGAEHGPFFITPEGGGLDVNGLSGHGLVLSRQI